MEVDHSSPAGQSAVSRDKTAPFLIRTFVKIGSFHRLSLFEDGTLPTTDEQQLFTWKDATLREVLTTLRNTAPHVPEYRHPLARFSFRTVYADSGNKGRFSQKELGMVYSRDILGEPGTLTAVASRIVEENDENREPTDREKEERTLDELRFVPGDYLLLAVLLPKNVTMGSDLSIKGSASAAATQNGPGWKGDGGWGKTVASGGVPALGRGGGHWRGDSNGRGRGGRGGARGEDREEREDSRIPPPRSPRRSGRGWGDRGGRGGRRSPRSRSRSPPRRRGD
ncbi:Sin3 associated polypeptide p18-domain-containing protein [Rhodocollybia butyracea]|uniref:Sin3 associated polypeptide p18-domain-containing protein n=1 Tax=Rhodocollybia butyracea TaxID=206335 RepID=A0A9P5PVE7_9AGAR|nr:Sin3 associated polypeptide p18-domain-containing protein [Rhodocollybia butyracea]